MVSLCVRECVCLNGCSSVSCIFCCLTFQQSEQAELARRLRELQEGSVENWQVDPAAIALGRKLGEGSFGEVFEAEWEGTRVAVKRFREELNSDFTAQMWRRELGVNANLRHPNIVLFHGASLREGQQPMMVMELLFASLHQVLEAVSGLHGGLTAREAVDLLTDAARGLAYLHDRRTVHGDVRPTNMMVDRDMRVKIADLGEAKTTINTKSRLPPTSPNYCAPERLAANAAADGRINVFKADVFSFGVSIIEVCTCTPADSRNRLVQLNSIKREWRPLAQLARDCVKERSPEERPTMCEVLAELRRIKAAEVFYVRGEARSRKLVRDHAGRLVMVPLA
jgi:serine/threonine protein kinase